MSTKRTKQIWSQIDSNTLHQAYQQSVTNNPEMHPLAQTDRQADFLAFCSGIKSTIGYPQLRSYVTGDVQPGMQGRSHSTGQSERGHMSQVKNLPDNVRGALSKIGSRSFRTAAA